MNTNQERKVYEIFVVTPEGVSDICKNVWSYIKKMFDTVGATVSVLSSSKKYNIPTDRNLFWVKIFLTEDQLDKVKNMEDVLHIFCQSKLLK